MDTIESINQRYRKGIASLSGNPDLPLNMYGILWVWHTQPNQLFGSLRYPLEEVHLEILATSPVMQIGTSLKHAEVIQDQTWVTNAVIAFMNSIKEFHEEWKTGIARIQGNLRISDQKLREEEKTVLQEIGSYNSGHDRHSWEMEDLSIFVEKDYRRKRAEARFHAEKMTENATKDFESLRKMASRVLAARIEKLHSLEHPNCPWDGKTLFPDGNEIEAIDPDEMLKIALREVK